MNGQGVYGGGRGDGPWGKVNTEEDTIQEGRRDRLVASKAGRIAPSWRGNGGSSSKTETIEGWACRAREEGGVDR